MASEKITAMPDWAGNQVPTDLLTGVDLSQPTTTQNVKSTLNDLFEEITKNITDLSLSFSSGDGVFTVSAANKGKLGYSQAAQSFQVSENGVTYANLIKGVGANTRLAFYTAAATLSGSANLTWVSPALTIGVAGATTGLLTLASAGGANATTLSAGNAAAALNYIFPATSPTAGQVLSASAPSGSNVTLSWTSASAGTVTGSGTATRVAFWTSASAIGSDANYYWDNTNKRLSIGAGTTPSQTVDIKANVGEAQLNLIPSSGTPRVQVVCTSAEGFVGTSTAHTMHIQANNLPYISIDPVSGQVGINFTTLMAAQLHILSATNATPALLARNASSTGVDIARFENGGSILYAFNDTGLASFGEASAHTGTIRLFNASGTTTTSISAGNAASTLNFILPVVNPTAGQVLSASAPSGSDVTLSWISPSAAATPGTPVNSVQFNNPLGTFAGDAGLLYVAGSTTGNQLALASSTITSGNLFSIAMTGTGALSNTKTALSIASSGANGTASQTVFGQTISVTNTGTTNTNIALQLTASGGATANTALSVTAGRSLFADGSTTVPGWGFQSGPTLGFSYNASGLLLLSFGINQVMYTGSETRQLSTATLTWSSGTPTGAVADLILRRSAAANLAQGAADAAAPVAQFCSVQNVVAGTSNTAGALWTFDDSIGTGNASSGGWMFRTHPAGGSGTAQNAAVNTLSIPGTGTGIGAQTLFNITASSTGITFGSTAHTINFHTNGSSNIRFYIDANGILYAGNGDVAASPASGTLSGTGGSGSNISAGDLDLRGGLPTGSGTPGGVIIQLGGNTAAASTLNSVAHSIKHQFATSQITQLWRLLTTTTAETQAGTKAVFWTLATHATRTAAMSWSLVNNAVEAEYARLTTANGGGTFAGTPVALAIHNGTAPNIWTDGARAAKLYLIDDPSLPAYGVAANFSATILARPAWQLLRGRGTNGSPAAIQSGDVMGEVQWCGQFDGTTNGYGIGCAIRGVATETWSSSANGSGLFFYTATTGALTAPKMSLENTGTLRIGATSGSFNTTTLIQAGTYASWNTDVIGALYTGANGTKGLEIIGTSGQTADVFRVFRDSISADLFNVSAAVGTRVRSGLATGSTNLAYVGGNLKTNTTGASNVSTTETDLISYTLPALTLGTNGDYCEIEAAGTFSSAVSNKRVRMYFGTTVIFDTTALAFGSSSWYIYAKVIRTGATAQIAIGIFDGNLTLITQNSLKSTPGETLSGTVAVKCTGQGGASDEITQDWMNVQWFPNGQ